MNRASGILLHVSSLPGGHGIGDIGLAAHDWVNFLAASRQQYWQILPLNPVAFGNSPYSSPSSFAGNPLLISLDALADDGLLERPALAANWLRNRVDFEKVRAHRREHLQVAFTNFTARGKDHAYEKYVSENPWLRAFAAFMAPREKCSPESIVFQQYIFEKQWLKLRAHANACGVKIVGDLPMYISADSAECVETPDLFDNVSGFVSGAPPCNVHPMGQRWGNPLYRWDAHQADGFKWWLSRLRNVLKFVDVVRLDYFCGYDAFWATTGKTGHWRRGPGRALFDAVRREFGPVPFIAEDLGSLTPEINQLRDSFGIMSTKVLQYAFDGMSENPYVPENFHNNNCVVYTGTHDNDTARGWYDSTPDYVRENLRNRGFSGNDISWDLIKLAAQSRADLAITPFQDVLCLGREARFNTPGTVSNSNWCWRLSDDQVSQRIADALTWLVKFGRREPPERQEKLPLPLKHVS